jgi:hypothetical protein
MPTPNRVIKNRYSSGDAERAHLNHPGKGHALPLGLRLIKD